MKCKYCNKPAVKENLCRNHFIEEYEKIFTDNTDKDNLGIIRFLKYMLPEHFRDNFNSAHKEVLLMLLRLYDPRYTNKLHRERLLIAFRGFAKSKLIFGFMMYIITHNNKKIKVIAEDNTVIEILIQERYIVLFSETATMAEEFVSNIRDELSTNQLIKYFYHFVIQDAIDSDTGQWTRKAFKINDLYVVGLGAKQQARGRVKGAYRPTFAIFDDIYSENNTITAESRYAMKSWFYNSAINTVDDLLGKVFLVGTIIHEDTVLIECEKNSTWETLKYTPMNLMKFKELIARYTKDGKLILPYDDISDKFLRIKLQQEHFKELEKEYEILWPDRMGLYNLILKYKEALEHDNLTGFYQEYFHELLPRELRKFNRDYFQYIDNVTLENVNGYTFIVEGNRKEIINIEFGIDIAGGKKEGDNTVITVVGIKSNGDIIVIDQVIGKFVIRDYTGTALHGINTDESLIIKRGYIDETYRLAIKYNPRLIKIGFGGGHEGAIIEEFRRLFNASGLYIPIVARPQNRNEGEKYERIERTLLPFYEARKMYHTRGLQQLEYELEFLRKAKTDDAADSLEVAMWMLQRPIEVPDEYMRTDKIRLHSFKQKEYEDYDWLLP